MPDLAPLLTPERHELVELVRELHSQALLGFPAASATICIGARQLESAAQW